MGTVSASSSVSSSSGSSSLSVSRPTYHSRYAGSALSCRLTSLARRAAAGSIVTSSPFTCVPLASDLPMSTPRLSVSPASAGGGYLIEQHTNSVDFYGRAHNHSSQRYAVTGEALQESSIEWRTLRCRPLCARRERGFVTEGQME